MAAAATEDKRTKQATYPAAQNQPTYDLTERERESESAREREIDRERERV